MTSSRGKKRFGDVVVAAHFEAEHAVEVGVAGGNENDRYLRRRRADVAEQAESVDVRQHDVQNPEVR